MTDNDAEFVRRLKAHFEDAILSHGFGVQYVGAVTSEQRPFAYTVGRTLYQKPELLVSGPFPAEHRHRILTKAVRMDEEGGVLVNQPILGVRENEVPLFAIKVAPWRPPMSSALAMFGQIEALQLLWPDDNGRFPGDPECSLTPGLQVVFA